MRILVTNDDGIHAPGLKVCEAIVRGYASKAGFAAVPGLAAVRA